MIQQFATKTKLRCKQYDMADQVLIREFKRSLKMLLEKNVYTTINMKDSSNKFGFKEVIGEKRLYNNKYER